MPFQPVSNTEWQYLKRRFRGLWGGRMDERGTVVSRTETGLRQLFDEGMPGNGLEDDVRRRARTIVRERVREFSVEAYADPYFELEWDRAAADNPELAQYPVMAESRRLLWEAYYRRDETEARRGFAQKEWRKLAGVAGRDDNKLWEDT
jgi:hypothetical protein